MLCVCTRVRFSAKKEKTQRGMRELALISAPTVSGPVPSLSNA